MHQTKKKRPKTKCRKKKVSWFFHLLIYNIYVTFVLGYWQTGQELVTICVFALIFFLFAICRFAVITILLPPIYCPWTHSTKKVLCHWVTWLCVAAAHITSLSNTRTSPEAGFFLEGVDRRKKIIKTRPKSRRHYRQKCISHENKSDSRFLMLGGDVRLSHICEISFESSDVILPESTVHAFPAMQFRSFI